MTNEKLKSKFRDLLQIKATQCQRLDEEVFVKNVDILYKASGLTISKFAAACNVNVKYIKYYIRCARTEIKDRTKFYGHDVTPMHVYRIGTSMGFTNPFFIYNNRLAKNFTMPDFSKWWLNEKEHT